MARADFAHIDTWIFDLDNTLYPADCNLFGQIDERMGSFLSEFFSCDFDQARRIQKDYYVRYGTTLSGMMREHGMCPHEFMDYVHDIDLAAIGANHDLRARLEALPGKRYIFTNGSAKHAENVAGKLGIFDLFHDVFDIEAGDFLPKPHAPTYHTFSKRFGIQPTTASFFEDMEQNLRVPHEEGMRTVLVQSEAEWLASEPDEKRPSTPGEAFDHVHHVTSDLTQFLGIITTPAHPSNQ